MCIQNGAHPMGKEYKTEQLSYSNKPDISITAIHNCIIKYMAIL